MSHSFDQRLYYDGTSFIEMHLGDAYPRQIVMARAGDEAGLRAALDADGPGIAQVAELAARGMSRNAQWFLLANATPARLAALTAR